MMLTSRAGGHRRIPVGVDDTGEFVGGHRRHVLERQPMHGAVVAGQQIGRCAHLGHVLRAVPVTGVIARQVQPEPVHPVGPRLLNAGDVRQLDVLDAGTVPDQPRDAVRFGRRPVIGDLVGQAVGELVDVFDQPGKRVPEQFPGRFVACCHGGDATLSRRAGRLRRCCRADHARTHRSSRGGMRRGLPVGARGGAVGDSGTTRRTGRRLFR